MIPLNLNLIRENGKLLEEEQQCVISKYPEELSKEKWILLEFQGNLCMSEANSSFRNFALGTIEFPSKVKKNQISSNFKDKATLVMKRHTLQGTLIKMEKPFALMCKSSECFSLNAIIRYKCIFSSPPKHNTINL